MPQVRWSDSWLQYTRPSLSLCWPLTVTRLPCLPHTMSPVDYIDAVAKVRPRHSLERGEGRDGGLCRWTIADASISPVPRLWLVCPSPERQAEPHAHRPAQRSIVRHHARRRLGFVPRPSALVEDAAQRTCPFAGPSDLQAFADTLTLDCDLAGFGDQVRCVRSRQLEREFGIPTFSLAWRPSDRSLGSRTRRSASRSPSTLILSLERSASPSGLTSLMLARNLIE